MLARPRERPDLGARPGGHGDPWERMTDCRFEFEGEVILDAVRSSAGRECDPYAPQVDHVGWIGAATGERDECRVESQELAAKIVARLVEKSADRDVEAAVRHGGELLVVIESDLFDLELGLQARETIECKHRGVMAWYMGHPKLRPACAREPPDRVECVENVSSGGQQPLPRECEAHRARTANEQRRAHLALELANRP